MKMKSAVLALLLTSLPVLARAETVPTSQTEAAAGEGTSIFAGGDRPWVGIEVSGGATGFGDQTLKSGAPLEFDKLPVRMQVDVQPLHALGVLSAGITTEYYFTRASAALRKAYSLGGQVRYQAKFFDYQLIVPMAAYSTESFFYKLSSGPSNRFVVRGPTFGLWVFLNAIDRNTARGARRDLGLSRTYLTLERRTIEGEDGAFSITGSAYQLGLRIEI